jgi:thiol-disulfide isomerase/thioredoxin
MLIGACACAYASNLAIGDPAPPITVAKWVQGTPVKSGPGGLRVVEFWATWCGPCKESIPHLSLLAKKYQGKVSFTGVDIAEHTESPVPLVQAFVKSMGPKMSYNVAVDGVAGTMGKTWMEAAHQEGIPTAFVIGKTGEIVWIGHPMEGLDEALGKMIAGTYDLKKAKADFALALKESTDREKSQAAMQEVGEQVKQAAADYKAGKKEAALAAFDKIQAPVPEIQNQIAVYKFSLWYPDDKVAAKTYAEKQLMDPKIPTDLLFQYAAAAGLRVGATPEDKAFGVSLADRALKAAPTDPIVEYEASMFYADDKQNDKAIALNQDALKNIGNAKPEIQDRLKQAIQKKLDDLKPKKS